MTKEVNYIKAKISLTITVNNKLFIGGGEIIEQSYSDKNNEEKERLVQDYIRDCHGKPYIPASSIKGIFRDVFGINEKDKNELFGYVGENNNESRGGKLIFCNAYHQSGEFKEIKTGIQTEQKKLKYLSTHVQINPITGAAKSHNLYSFNYVPAGNIFTYEIIGENISEEELKNFVNKIPQTIKFGGKTTNDWGECSIVVNTIEGITKEDFSEASQEYPKYKELPKHTFKNYEETKQLVFDITLNFNTPFLVCDPGHHKEKGDTETSDLVYLSKDNKPILPASSFRGALSHQYQRIARTKDTKLKEVISKLFGYKDYKALLSFTDFISEASVTELIQDFIAVDRFTGGTKEGAKFKIKAAVNPILKGKIILNTQRYKEEIKEELSLLLLILRDLIEGDISFGYGSSKGYGVCTAEITVKGEHPLKPKIEFFLAFFQSQDKAA